MVTGPAGASPGDVTAQLVKLIKDHQLVAKSDERTLGHFTATDPKLKQPLTVSYELDGQTQPALVLGVDQRGEPLIAAALSATGNAMAINWR